MEMEDMQQVPAAHERANDREPESSRRRVTVLIMLGCSILQLPIWGFAMSFGIFQEAYTTDPSLRGSSSSTGIIGTTMNGVLYLSMPVLSTLLDNSGLLGTTRWRRGTGIAGTLLSSAAFLLASWSKSVWQLVVLQGVLAALGAAMLYTPTTLFVDEWFRDGNRATAWGVQLSAKNVVGTACPFLFSACLNEWGFRGALRIWAGMVLVTGLLGIAVIPTEKVGSNGNSTHGRRRRRKGVPWTFLRHRTFYIHAIANMIFSSGYGLPQTYLATFAHSELRLSTVLSSLMIVVFNVPGIVSCVGFGLLSDRFALAADTNTFISAFGSALSVFLLWGLKSHQIEGLLIAFAAAYGFFAGGYSSTWGGWIREMESEAAERNEAINTGMIYGMLNGARGLGYAVSGLAGVQLLKAGPVNATAQWAYGTPYGGMILFTGLSSLVGGWSIAWR